MLNNNTRFTTIPISNNNIMSYLELPYFTILCLLHYYTADHRRRRASAYDVLYYYNNINNIIRSTFIYFYSIPVVLLYRSSVDDNHRCRDPDFRSPINRIYYHTSVIRHHIIINIVDIRHGLHLQQVR